jgi:DNA excision repair protein ERCC-2
MDEVRRAIRKALPRCAKALAKLSLHIRSLCQPASPGAEPVETKEADGERDLFSSDPPALKPGDGSQQCERRGNAEVVPLSHRVGEGSGVRDSGREGILTTKKWPEHLTPLVDDVLKQAETWLAQNQAAEFRESLLELYFHLLSFRRTADLYDERYVTIVEAGASVRVRLYCLDPSHLLRQALERGRAAVFFSATLTPLDYYRSLIGGGPEDPVLQLPSPFPPEHLLTLVQDRIRTDWKARATTLAQVVEAIGALVRGRRGNYLVYFPSYQYLADVRERFQTLHPSVRIITQRSGMTEAEREAFLSAFASEHEETLAGFAVAGGIFGEGIDLVGERLIGAVMVGVGLPQLCVERDLIKEHFQAKTGAGFDYAYTFPGMNRVLQAIGRVIRSETDRGAVLLIDTRFAEPRYRRLFPPWWRPRRARTSRDIEHAIRDFWDRAARPAPISAEAKHPEHQAERGL